jgi:N-carbamoyl-L-amino-acid hydrolase
MVTINPERVLSDLYHLRSIGAYKTGVHRPTLSSEDMQARHWLAERLRDLGHQTEIDGIANVVGLAPGGGRRILAGSHLESQNHAGWLDGALGVIYALEAARAVAESPQMGDAAVDVIAFADEEGHFGSFMGSRSYVGELDEAEIDSACDATNGTAMRIMLDKVGLAGRGRPRISDGRHAAFLEAHIEQGDWLEANDLKAGIVTSIVAIWQYRITFEGAQNHAGTTRMAIRKDAGVALTRLAQAIESRFPEVAGPRSVWTTGRIALEPGASSIIPGRAEMDFQFRDAEPETLARLEDELARMVAEAEASGPCAVRLENLSKGTPAVMDAAVQEALEQAAELHSSGAHTRMPSGASHDAQVMGPHLPTGMLFVPSIGGISHHWSENTSDEDIVTGARIYASAAAALLQQ